ncbi:UNVERIFIED_CONTAM: hypothetical protein NCL1_44679 [Trichonephila clavipes]
MGNILEATILSGKLQGEVALLPQIHKITRTITDQETNFYNGRDESGTPITNFQHLALILLGRTLNLLDLFPSSTISIGTNIIRKIVESMLLSIIFITSGKNSGERLREFGQPVERLRKTCKKTLPGTIPFRFGRVDTSIATESVLDAHFIIYALVTTDVYKRQLFIRLLITPKSWSRTLCSVQYNFSDWSGARRNVTTPQNLCVY